MDAARAAGPYAGWLRAAIQAFKFEDESDRAGHLAGLLAAAVADAGPFDLAVPVPLHPSRLRERGYNQSALLAAGVARAVGADAADALVRIRATSQQAKLDAAARRANVAGAFAVAPGLAPDALVGRTVLLIDDVATTGSTAGACAAVLVAAGAARVVLGTLARDA